MPKKLLEVCCGSLYDCIQAKAGGADRIELNSALYMGGLTPSIASLKLAKAKVDIPIIAMVRPRGAGFCYDDVDTMVMFEDALALLEAGADGIAFGFLTKDYCIDMDKTKAMIDLIHQYGKEAVFHRAIDCVKDMEYAMKQLITLGVQRVLTSGQQAKAETGKVLLTKLQEQFGQQIEILVGSGINAGNVSSMIETTKVSQVHSSCKSYLKDSTTALNGVSYAYLDAPHQNEYDVVSKDVVATISALLKKQEKPTKKHIIFDIDGTVLNNTSAVLLSLQDTLREVMHQEYPLDKLCFALGITGEDALCQLGCENIEEAQRLWDFYLMKYQAEVNVYEGIEETMKQLKEHGFHVGLVSSKTYSEYETEVKPFSFNKYLDLVILADDTIKHKPHPEPLLAYLKKAQINVDEAIYVGDSIYDIKCANAAGMTACLAMWGTKLTICKEANALLEKPMDIFYYL